MILVIDANILISFIIKPKTTIDIFTDESIAFYAPSIIKDEVLKHKDVILKKASIEENELLDVLSSLFNKIELVDDGDYYEYYKKAKEICPDYNDIPYFALALKLEIPMWSNDKLLKNQNMIKILNTKEILEILNIIK